MPCCLFALLIFGFPRLAVAALWLFTPWVGRAVPGGALLPLLGIALLPYTLLWYLVVMNVYGGHWGLWQVIFLVLALAFDFSSYGGAARRRRD